MARRISGGRALRRNLPAMLLLALAGNLPPPSWASIGPTLAEIDSLRIAGRVDSALAAISRAIPAAEAAGESARLLGLQLRRGELLTSVGYAREGEQVLRRAIATAQASGDSATAMSALRWLSVAVDSQGRAAEAYRLYRQLLDLAVARGDGRHEAWARVGLAWGALRDGRSHEAVDEYERATDLFRSIGDRRALAWAENGLGTAFSALGKFDESRSRYKIAQALARDTGYTMVQCLSANNLGTLEYSLGDPGTAAGHYREAMRLYRGLEQLRESVIPGINLAICEAEMGRLTQAADTLAALLARCRGEGHADLSAKIMNQLARTRDLQGLESEARALYRSVIGMGEHAPMKNRVEASAGLARLLVDADSSMAAVELLSGLAATLPADCNSQWRIQTEIAAGEARLELGDPERALIHFRAADRLADSVGIELWRDDALFGASLAWRELGRPDSAASALESATRIWESLRARPADPEWREARGRSGQTLCAERIALDLATGAGARRAYERAQTFKARTLLERISGPQAIVDGRSTTVPLARLQAELLEPDDLLLDFFIGSSSSYLFAISRDSCRVIALPGAQTIAPKVRLYYDLLRLPPGRRGEEAAVRAAGSALSASLLGGATDLIDGKKRVYFAPDGFLSLVPLELGQGIDGPVWIRIPSAAILALIRARDRGGSGEADRILALAGEPSSGAGLPGIGREVRRLAGRYRNVEARYLTDRDTLRLADLADAMAILHVASHAETDDERPWLSNLCVGAGGLQAERLARSSIPVRLAVLSSCQSMHGRVETGEGVLGLSAALLSAGADCVVATLWPVDDRTTAEFMEAFYDALASGRSIAGAIRDAREGLESRPATAHPFFWAAFVPIGLGEIQIPIQSRTASGLPKVLLALLVLAAIGWAIIVRSLHRRSVIRPPQERLMG